MNPPGSHRSVRFTADRLSLSGVLHLPPAPPSAVVIGCHGLLADKNSPKQIALANRCVSTKMAYLRFDHRGCGESEGIFECDTTLKNRQADLRAAIRMVRRTFGSETPIGLFGSSLGGTVCLAAFDFFSPFAVVTLAAPVHHQSIRMPEKSPDSLKEELMKNRLTFDIRHRMGAVHHILILHGKDDETVPVQNAQILFSLAGKPKKVVLLDGADHRISAAVHQEIVIRTSLAWLVTSLEKVS